MPRAAEAAESLRIQTSLVGRDRSGHQFRQGPGTRTCETGSVSEAADRAEPAWLLFTF